MKDTQLPGTGYCLGPVINIELAIDAGCVGLDGTWSYNELAGNFLVSPAQRHEIKNFQLTLA